MSDEQKTVRIDLKDCKDIFDVINATIDGEVKYHKELDNKALGVNDDFAAGFIAGMETVKDIVDKTRSVNELIPFMFDDDDA